MKERRPWQVKEWLQHKCPHCGRMRLNLSENGKHLCEKCDWCPEENRRILDEEFGDEVEI
jgi:uncharacterized protein (DUF983 family)